MPSSLGAELPLIVPLLVHLHEDRGHEHQEREPCAEQEDDLHHPCTMGRHQERTPWAVGSPGRGLFAAIDGGAKL